MENNIKLLIIGDMRHDTVCLFKIKKNKCKNYIFKYERE